MSRQVLFIIMVILIQVIAQFLSVKFEYYTLYKITGLAIPCILILCGFSSLFSDKCRRFWNKKIRF